MGRGFVATKVGFGHSYCMMAHEWLGKVKSFSREKMEGGCPLISKVYRR